MIHFHHMHPLRGLVLLCCAAGLAAIGYFLGAPDEVPTMKNNVSTAEHLQIESADFPDNGFIPIARTCDDVGSSPPLSISGVPEKAKSLALIVDDPDVPTSIRADGLWNHWVVYNMPTNQLQIPEGTQPEGVAGKGSAGSSSYTPPCPPNGEHRYFFKLYALDAMLDLPEGATKADLEKTMQSHILAQATLIGRYGAVRPPKK